MTENRPNVNPNGAYGVKATCNYLGITRSTLLKYRTRGLITQKNPTNSKRPLYSGAEILRCWDAFTTQ